MVALYVICENPKPFTFIITEKDFEKLNFVNMFKLFQI